MSAQDSANLAPSLSPLFYDDSYELWTTEIFETSGAPEDDVLIERSVRVTAAQGIIQNMSRLALEGSAVEDTQAFEEMDGHERSLRKPEMLRLADGRLLERVHYFDTPGHEAMTHAIKRGRAERYDQAGWLEHPENEIAGGMTGENVEIFALRDPTTGQIVASVRLFHGSKPEELPSYAKAHEADALKADGIKLVRERTQGRPVAEVGDLWGLKEEYRQDVDEDDLPPCPPDAVFELYRWLARATMERNGVLIVGAVGPETQGLLRYFGPHVVRVLGERFDVGDPTAKKKVKLTPIMMDPCTVVSDLLDWANEAIDATFDATDKKTWADSRHEALRRHVRVWDLAEVTPAGLIDADLGRRLKDADVRLEQLRRMKYGVAA